MDNANSLHVLSGDGAIITTASIFNARIQFLSVLLETKEYGLMEAFLQLHNFPTGVGKMEPFLKVSENVVQTTTSSKHINHSLVQESNLFLFLVLGVL